MYWLFLRDGQAVQAIQPGKQSVNTPASRSVAWPMQGGLQTITNTTTARTQTVVPAQTSSSIVVKTEPSLPLQDARQAKTPSPKKLTAAPGKENVASTTPQSVD